MIKLLSPLFALTVTLATALMGSAHAQDAKGDAKAGEKKVAMCLGCHSIVGYQASFPAVYRVPMISGQSPKYIVAALNEYKTGARRHPTMRGIAESLNDQDMADLAAYFATNGAVAGGESAAAKAPSSLQPGPKAAVLLKAANCASCHGSDFNSPIDANPKLAGQHLDYMQFAAKSYLNPNNPSFGRNHAAMGGLLKAQKDQGAKEFDAQLKETLQYISKLPSDLKVVPTSKFR